MSNKNRLGRDPLEFIKDTRNEENNQSMDDSESATHVTTEKSQHNQPKKILSDTVIKLSKADIHLKSENDTLIFRIEGGLTIYSASRTKEVFMEHSVDYAEIDIDLSTVKKIDTAGFQLLLFFKKEMALKEKTTQLINAPEDVSSIFRLYGEAV